MERKSYKLSSIRMEKKAGLLPVFERLRWGIERKNELNPNAKEFVPNK